MNKKSIVRQIILKKEGVGKYGPFWIFEITFDNQDKGDFISKENPQTIFIEGREIEYFIEIKQNGNYTNYTIKPVKEKAFDKIPKTENKQAALNNAVVLASSGKIQVTEIWKYADNFLKYLKDEPS